MTIEESIEFACRIVGMAYASIGNFSEASDCFCGDKTHHIGGYQNSGVALRYVREAVREKLIRDGHKISGAIFFPDEEDVSV